MARVTVEDCMQKVPTRFGLVLMASIRAKQLLRGAKPLVRADQNRAVVVSLREIASGVVHPDAEEEDPS